MNSEPTISSERQFQEAVLSALRRPLESRGSTGTTCSIIEQFGLDVAVLIKSPVDTMLRFIEFKAYAAQRPAGVGFGDQKGRGPQVDLLMLPDSLLESLDRSVRWCFVDVTLPKGKRRYSAITCFEAKRAAMGQVGPGKQNNFRIKAALDRPLTWDELILALEGFLLGHG